jgi:thiol:disulfide interchange protein DsbD
MKELLSFLVALISISTFAQSPTKWEFSAKKISDKTYEIHLTATIDNGWHTFSQTQPKEALAQPTKISFNKNPLVQLKGKAKEVGVIEKYKEKTLGIEQWQYAGKVDFVQTVVIKSTPALNDLRSKPSVSPNSGGHSALKTNITGSITYQTCNDHECLPPKTIAFSVPIENK